MKRPSYLQQIAPGASGRPLAAGPVLAPPRLLFRPGSAASDPVGIETRVAPPRAAVPGGPVRAPAVQAYPTARPVARAPLDLGPEPRRDRRWATTPPAAAVPPPSLHEPAPPRIHGEQRTGDQRGAGKPARPAVMPDVAGEARSPVRFGGTAAKAPPLASPGAFEAPPASGARPSLPPDRSPRAPVEPGGVSQPAAPDRPNRVPEPPAERSPRPREDVRDAFAPIVPRIPSPPANGAGPDAAAAALPVIAPPPPPRPPMPARERSASGLHIGTLEVRVVMPSPPQPPPAGPRAAARTPIRGGGGTTRRIARGFSVFGLGQT